MSADTLFLGGTSVELIQDRNKPVFTASVGGGITNSAIIGARLGLKTALLSRIGRDPLGDFAIDFLRSCGINTSGIVQDPCVKTPIAAANIDKYGNSRYVFYKNSPKDSMDCVSGVSFMHLLHLLPPLSYTIKNHGHSIRTSLS